MELLSACAVHLSLLMQTADQLRSQRQDLWSVLKNLIDSLERDSDMVAQGYRTANACAALAQHLKLSEHQIWRLQIAGLIHHLAELMPQQGTTSSTLLADIDALDDVAPLVEASLKGECLGAENEDGTGDEVPCQILSACRVFISQMRAKPDADGLAIIDDLPKLSSVVSEEVLACLRSCHLDGSLYQQAVIS